MKKLTLISSAILFSFSSISTLAQANTFQQEVVGGYIHTSDVNVLMAGFTHHFEQQSVTKGPWAEAAYLNKSSFIGGALTYLDSDHTNSDTGYTVFGQGMLNDSYYLNAMYSKTDEVNLFGIGGGFYLTPNSSIYVNYNNSDADFEDSTYTLTLGYKQVARLSNNDFVTVNAEITDLDSAFISYSATADYYFSPKTYLGFGLAYNDFDQNGSHTDIELSAGHFFNNQVGVDLTYLDGDGDNVTTVSAVFRF